MIGMNFKMMAKKEIEQNRSNKNNKTNKLSKKVKGKP